MCAAPPASACDPRAIAYGARRGMSGLQRLVTEPATKKISHVSAGQRGSDVVVVRGRVELPTFRFLGTIEPSLTSLTVAICYLAASIVA